MFLEILKAILLGVVEGVTEFLPISSTGHLIIFNEWFSFQKPFTFLFDMVIQLGAISAVVVYFWKKLFVLDVWKKTLLGVAPALVIGFLFHDIVEKKLFNPWTVAIALIVGGMVMLIVEQRAHKPVIHSLTSISYKTAFFIGLIQCLALIPGTSRSAATIIGAMLFGATRATAAEYSFFLAIPTMIAASGYSLFKQGFTASTTEITLLTTGFLTAFLTALVVIRFFMRYIQTHNFKQFAYYRIVLGLLLLFLFL